MRARDASETHRAATPLELLFDLTLVVAFGAASDELAHLLAQGHVAAALTGFTVAIFATCWAWINYTWFASAYDNDDWFFRVATMVQMFGVLLLSLGLPQFFESLEAGESPDLRVMVAGYVVMRVSMVVLWIRAARGDPRRRRVCLTYAGLIALAQVGWVAVAVFHPPLVAGLVLAGLLIVAEMATPVVAERQGPQTPWHPHHVAERYSLLVIIALGEGVLGTTASISAVVQEQGWSVDAVVVGFAGVVLIFGMWWIYFMPSQGDLLEHRPERSFLWGYGHILVYGSIAAVGAGLHVAANYVEGESELGVVATVLAVVVPVALFVLLTFGLYALLVVHVDPFHLLLLLGTGIFLVVGLALAAAGVSLELSLAVVALAPWVSVVGYETVGHRRGAAAMEGLAERRRASTPPAP
ncbi:Low temperature requirement protein LtrA [Paraoerskovia marina]|uniref:Low temperature requirement protein LtrA n=2 Tax=Paraoerskovia marina TaxID=545619 RepID=A0A1H1MEW8_9CELL|nr:Low temperature requirement protein LtrA [Paraoerskovia marina]